MPPATREPWKKGLVEGPLVLTAHLLLLLWGEVVLQTQRERQTTYTDTETGIVQANIHMQLSEQQPGGATRLALREGSVTADAQRTHG